MKPIFTLIAAVLFTANIFAQAPEKMSYQAVVRDQNGNLKTNAAIGVQITINKDAGLFPTIVYTERHTATTNANGLISLEIGTGTVVNGNFSTIDWGNGSYTLSTNYDLSGGTNYSLIGSSKLLSVPYALYAKTAGNASSSGLPSATTTGQMMYWNGTSWALIEPAADGMVLSLESGLPVWKEQQTVSNLPIVITTNITDVTENSATCGGSILSSGGFEISAKGICWSSTNIIPTINDNIVGSGNGMGNFTIGLTNLPWSNYYYVRAYAVNSMGVSYGDVKTIESPIVVDADGNIYHTVKIGTQVWMVENLKTTKYNDGSAIPLVTDNTAWRNLSTPGYCWYNNNKASNGDTYGALYNWYVVETGKLCPAGWHVPNDAEWTQLTDYLGGTSVAGGKLKEAGTTHWNSPNTGATNDFGFTTLPAGYRDLDYFKNIGNRSYLWSVTEISASGSNRAWYRLISNDISEILRYSGLKEAGFSVRCVRD